jgi:hypothetical protein
MGNFNTPGFVKFWWNNDFVETKYESIHQIPVITIDKKEHLIPSDTSIVCIVHFDDSSKYAEIYSKLGAFQNLKVYGVPNQDSKESFDKIRSSNGQSLGKMVMNGPRTHPLFKFLKRNCDTFYSYSTKSAKVSISKPLGMFFIDTNLSLKNTKVTYFDENQINDFIRK